MRVVAFTPTRRWGGLDVSYASILRQETDAEIIWMIGDNLYEQRAHTIAQLFNQAPLKISHFKPHGEGKNLAQAYNEALAMARLYKADMLISLQDYIYIEPDGVQKFLDMAEDIPDAIFSGITHISSDPEPDKIMNPIAPFTIFGEAYERKPSNIEWQDVRYSQDGKYSSANPVEWEANWAAIPSRALYDKKLQFDTEFDSGAAYENQDYAYLAASRGYSIFIDHTNQAISLPHKKYFAQEWESEKPLTIINKMKCEEKWG